MRGSRTGSANLTIGFILALTAAALTGCEEDGLQGAAAEVTNTKVKLDLPQVPSFETPSPHPDGSHSVREMRLKGRQKFETEVDIRGFVTWIYSCEDALRGPEMTVKQVRKIIEANPEKCNRPHFFLGDAADTPAEKALWVVENPRKLRRDERRRLSRAAKKAIKPPPVFDVGDEVIVKGTWDIRSPNGFFRSDGLLVFKDINNLTNPDGKKKKKK